MGFYSGVRSTTLEPAYSTDTHPDNCILVFSLNGDEIVNKETILNPIAFPQLARNGENAVTNQPYITKSVAPLLIVHSDHDPLVPCGQSVILEEALKNRCQRD